ncbi:MAG: tetraacyldisaccharide 4'-kinase [Bacteroidota bacterium]
MRLAPILSYLFLPFSILYGGIMSVRNFLYDRKYIKAYEAQVPIISVGNISMGGTGKTPMAEYLIHHFDAKGIKVAYLSRGYGRKTKGYYAVEIEKGDATKYGDEALQLARKFPQIPVAVCEDRSTGVRKLVQQKVEPIILDDAFQHRKLARDLDIVLIDVNRLPYQDFVLPSGSLREPLRGIKRADMLIINKLKSPSQIAKIDQKLSKWGKMMAFAKVVQGDVLPFTKTEPILSISESKEKEVILFSGIGNADFFEDQMREAGWKIKVHLKFGDHHDFTSKDLERLLTFAEKDHIFICTEKDYCRLSGNTTFLQLKQEPFYYIPIQLEFLSGEQGLLDMLGELNLNTTQDRAS